MKRLLLSILSCCILTASFAQGNGATFEQQLRAFLYVPGAEAVTGKYLSQTKGSQYTTYYYASPLPLEGFSVRVEDTNGWYQLRAKYTGAADQATLYNNLLSTFRKMGPDYTTVIDELKGTTLTSNGTLARPRFNLTSAKDRAVHAEFLTDGTVVIDLFLNLETAQSRWDHRIHEKISTEAECLAAMNGLLKKTVGKTFKDHGVPLGTITKLEVSATGLVYTVTKKTKAGSKAAPQTLTITYSGIDWKECDIDAQEAAVLEGLTVVVVSLDAAAQVSYNENGKVTREETEKIEELTVLQEDKREMIAYINWLSNQE